MYRSPYCNVCGGPFDPVELQDLTGLGTVEKAEEWTYDSQILCSDKSAVSQCFIERNLKKTEDLGRAR